MIDLEQMRKDMEAGTQGDWTADFDGEDDFDGVSIQSDFRGWNFEPIARCPVDFTDRCQRLADVHRIARLPQIEREYIALREAADALADACKMSQHQFTRPIAPKGHMDATKEKLSEALAAYRKATK